MRSKETACLLTGILLSIATGYLNTHTDEELVVLPWLLVATVVLGIAQSRRPWVWALLLGLALPVSQVVAYVLNMRVPYPNDPGSMVASLVGLVPAFVGAYIGATFRRAASS